MRRTTTLGVAALVGALAAGAAHVAARPVVGPVRAWVAAGANGVVWTAGAGLVADAYDRLPPAGVLAPDLAVALGGVSGGLASLSVGGIALLGADLLAFRYLATLGLFAFGVFTAGAGVGMEATLARLRAADAGTGRGPAGAGPGADGEGVPGDD